MIRVTCFILGLAGIAAPAAAQTGAGPARSASPPALGRPFAPPFANPNGSNNVDRALALERQVWSQEQTRRALSREPRERLDRAARVGALIDQGLCGPAAQLARAEHDAAMADRVPIACKAHRTATRS